LLLAIIQGNNAVIVESPAGAVLPYGPLPEWLAHHQTPLLIGTCTANPCTPWPSAAASAAAAIRGRTL